MPSFSRTLARCRSTVFLEMWSSSPISSFQTEWAGAEGGAGLRHEAVWFGLSWEKEALNRRINGRVKKMVEAGWVEETQGLIERYGDIATRIVLYNALGDRERFERYGEVARRLSSA